MSTTSASVGPPQVSRLTGLPCLCNAFQMCVKSDSEEPALGGNRLQGPAAYNNTIAALFSPPNTATSKID